MVLFVYVRSMLLVSLLPESKTASGDVPVVVLGMLLALVAMELEWERWDWEVEEVLVR